MIKKNLKILLITSVMALLPILAGLILWNQLPEQLPSHWNTAGEVDAWNSKPFSVFAIPLILLALQWLCVIVTSADPKRKNYSEKMLYLVFWIVPVLSIVLHTLIYLSALGMEVRIEIATPILLGLMFAIIGNYMPKCTQNYSIGIKLPWTLHSEENWTRTHRFAGKLWVASSFVIMLTSLLGSVWISLGITFLMVLAPTVYSYMLHQKGI